MKSPSVTKCVTYDSDTRMDTRVGSTFFLRNLAIEVGIKHNNIKRTRWFARQLKNGQRNIEMNVKHKERMQRQTEKLQYINT